VELYNLEYEQIFLSQLMQDTSTIDTYLGRIKDEDFVIEDNRKIFNIIIDLHSKGYKPTQSVVCSELVKSKDKELLPLVLEIYDKVPSSANIDYFFLELTSLSFRRRMKAEILKAANRIANVSENTQDIFSDLMRGLDAASFSGGNAEYSPLKKHFMSALEEMEKEHALGGVLPGITPRLSDLQDKLGSFGNGEYIIIGARTSIGKTVFALNNLARDAIFYDKKNVGYFSLEMSGTKLARRLLRTQSGADTSSRGMITLTTSFFEKMMIAGNELAGEDKLFIDDCEYGLTLSQFQARSRRMVRNDKCQMIILDYIGLIDSEQPKLPRHEQISIVSRACKRLARELDVPVFVLSQLTRGAEGEIPTLSMLRESGSLEQDADDVIFLHRERESNDTKIIRAKSRNGTCFTIDAVFNPDRLRFEDRR